MERLVAATAGHTCVDGECRGIIPRSATLIRSVLPSIFVGTAPPVFLSSRECFGSFFLSKHSRAPAPDYPFTFPFAPDSHTSSAALHDDRQKRSAEVGMTPHTWKGLRKRCLIVRRHLPNLPWAVVESKLQFREKKRDSLSVRFWRVNGGEESFRSDALRLRLRCSHLLPSLPAIALFETRVVSSSPR